MQGAQGQQGAQGDRGVAGAPPIQFGFVDFIDAQDSKGYLGLSGTKVVARELSAQISVPRDTTLSGLSVTADLGSASSAELSLLVDGEPTSLTCKITSADPECELGGEAVEVQSGQPIVLAYEASGGKAVKNLRFALGFENTP